MLTSSGWVGVVINLDKNISATFCNDSCCSCTEDGPGPSGFSGNHFCGQRRLLPYFLQWGKRGTRRGKEPTGRLTYRCVTDAAVSLDLRRTCLYCLNSPRVRSDWTEQTVGQRRFLVKRLWSVPKTWRRRGSQRERKHQKEKDNGGPCRSPSTVRNPAFWTPALVVFCAYLGLFSISLCLPLSWVHSVLSVTLVSPKGQQGSHGLGFQFSHH